MRRSARTRTAREGARFAQRVQTALLPAELPKRLKGVESRRRSRRRASSAATSTISSRPSRTRWSSPSASVRKGRAGGALQRVRRRAGPRPHVPPALSAGAIEPGGRPVFGQHDPAAAAARGVLLHALLRGLRPEAAHPDAGQLRAAVSDPLPAEGCAQIELPGVPLGSFQGSTYDEVTFALHDGDLFVLCTDGVFEAMNARGRGVHRGAAARRGRRPARTPPREGRRRDLRAVDVMARRAPPRTTT